MNTGKPRSLASRVPPPLFFAASLAASLYLKHLLGLGLARQLSRQWQAVAILLLVGGLLLAASAVGLFARHRTTIIPHGASSALITNGPYRLSRNPMYLSLSLLYLGLALWLRCWIALPLLALPLWLLNAFIIPMEESQMRQNFGKTYDEYCSRVRRWL